MLPPQKPTNADQQIFSLGCVLQSLREENNVEVLIEITIAYLKEQFDFKLIWIALYDRFNHILVGKGGITPSPNTSALRQRVVLSPGDLLEQVVIEQRTLGIADLRVEKRAEQWQEIAEKFNIQGTIILPIRYKDRCLGITLLGSERWGYMLSGEAKARLTMVLGELGAVLYQSEMDLHHKQAKRLDEALLQLLEKLRTLGNLEQKLEAVVQATHEFVSPTRTKIYWFEREKRFFWLRSNNQQMMAKTYIEQQAVSGITVEELNDFYYALSVNQIVSIGEGRSSLKSAFTVKLLQRLQARSLLAVPIIWQKDLLGFLAVEARESRNWSEVEKNFVKGAAGLISLVTPTESMETTIKQIQEDAQLTSQLTKVICKDSDTLEILRICSAKVLERLGTTRFLLLHFDSDKNYYQIIYQTQPYNRRNITSPLETLKELDWQLLQRSTEAIGVENIKEDLRFYNWRPLLLESGVHSFLISNCNFGSVPEALLVVANEANRSWNTQEKELLQAVAQQIGMIVRQWQLHQVTEQQQKILRSFQQCFRILEAKIAKNQPNEEFEKAALEQIASVLDCPLALLLSWTPDVQVAEVIPGVIANSQFAINLNVAIPLGSEILIHWALVTDGLLAIKVHDLPEQTRQWLNGSDIGQILVMALRTTADDRPTGIVLMADRIERQWSEQSLSALESLICQFAWSRQHLQIAQLLQSTTDNLQQLNWYKHRRLEEIERTFVLLLEQMHNLGIPTNELAYTRYQQLLRQLDSTATSINALVRLEQWQIHISEETLPIASLLKRSLERVENLLKQQKLWVGVHGLGQPIDNTSSRKDSTLSNPYDELKPQAMTIKGDVVKIESVLYELLVNACRRSVSGGRIDIWCRRTHEQLLEVSITDNGIIEPQLLHELHQDAPKKVLSPSRLNQPPGLHLLICQNLMQQMGGELHFYQLPDGRVVSRLLLLASGA